MCPADPTISEDLARQILEEIRDLRREMASALVGIHEVMAELRQVEQEESLIETELDAVSQRLGPPPSSDTCSSCGSQLERHPAPNGLLLICKACGRSSFFDRRSLADRRQSPGIQPEDGAPSDVDTTDGWTGK